MLVVGQGIDGRDCAITGKILDQLFYEYTITTPQRHLIEFKTQTGWRKTCHQQFIVFEFLACPDCKWFLPCQTKALPLNSCLRRSLCGH